MLPLVIPTVEPDFKNNSFFNDDNDSPDLEFLVEQINQLQKVITTNEVISKTSGKRALELAINVGKLLLDCKKELHCKSKRKGWVEWVGKNIQSIKYQTATRYIQLYEHTLSHDTDLDDCESIREAYYKVGIFKRKVDLELLPVKKPKVVEDPDPDPEPEDVDEPEPILEIPYETVRRLTNDLLTVFEKNKGAGENYTDMVNLLEPLVKLYHIYQPVSVT